ncbi:hypothetical protein A3D07_02980 [Candidatus Curtissbacteria bacterium RIFCSPHIGHO2_02_FULL_42_15]|uniref:Uncharacterized protein n=1 Tax=Candidatus Curtissbacteria bacterium RIFCSPHIGHO2_02_FULL_42_15 TaxID=1797716 RepID=A0A1F5GE62_9BACT|nr:MAG: hypothetical protein A3D07_02980 [Candidatus Curtissbacteria bacterium RIFCSPHIGHO2_02_FULL_42_15]
MKCERGIEKEGILVCLGAYCEPDYIDGSRIARNFNLAELTERTSKAEMDLQEKPESCQLQAAFNQLLIARVMRSGTEVVN